jgi:hypothetical protein
MIVVISVQAPNGSLDTAEPASNFHNRHSAPQEAVYSMSGIPIMTDERVTWTLALSRRCDTGRYL